MKRILLGLILFSMPVIAIADEITIHLRFGIKTSLGMFQDTLHFTEDEWNKRDLVTIEVAKQALADTWVVFQTKQLAEQAALETVQGKQDKIQEIDTKIADFAAVKARIQAELDTKQ